jgi:hypothetical protein
MSQVNLMKFFWVSYRIEFEKSHFHNLNSRICFVCLMALELHSWFKLSEDYWWRSWHTHLYYKSSDLTFGNNGTEFHMCQFRMIWQNTSLLNCRKNHCIHYIMSLCSLLFTLIYYFSPEKILENIWAVLADNLTKDTKNTSTSAWNPYIGILWLSLPFLW